MTKKLVLSAFLGVFTACCGAGANSDAKNPSGALGEPSGDVDPEIVGAAVREHSGLFQRCFQAGRERNPSLSGQVEIRFLINPDGGIGQADAFETSLPQEVTDCVISAFYKLKLPAQESAVIAQYPMFFQGS